MVKDFKLDNLMIIVISLLDKDESGASTKSEKFSLKVNTLQTKDIRIVIL